MTNFFNETIGALKEAGFDSTDILWIGSRDGKYATTYQNFASNLADFEYDNGYGSAEIPLDLVIVLKDDAGWFERAEYDGAEWWVFKRCPVLQPAHLPITNLIQPEMTWLDDVARFQKGFEHDDIDQTDQEVAEYIVGLRDTIRTTPFTYTVDDDDAN